MEQCSLAFESQHRPYRNWLPRLTNRPAQYIQVLKLRQKPLRSFLPYCPALMKEIGVCSSAKPAQCVLEVLARAALSGLLYACRRTS